MQWPHLNYREGTVGSESREDTVPIYGEPKGTGQRTRLHLNCPPVAELDAEAGRPGWLTPGPLQSPIFNLPLQLPFPSFLKKVMIVIIMIKYFIHTKYY